MIKRIQLGKILPLVGLISLLFACAGSPPVPQHEELSLFWPPPPDVARIAFVRSISVPEDLGIRKGFFQRLGEFFTGSTRSQLVKPMAVTLSSDNVLYVADPGVEGVHRFDLNAGKYQIIRRDDNEPLPSAVALVSGADGRVYVSDSQLDKVYRIDPGAEFAIPLTLDAMLKHPTGLAWSATTDRLFVVDTWSHHIKVFNDDGTLHQVLGRRGKEPGQFNYPTYIWLQEDGRLLITDSLNFRVQILDGQGKFINSFGQSGSASGKLSRPKGIAMDRQDHIYVVDSLFHSLQIFDQDGHLLLPIGQQGNGPGEFWLPVGIFISDENEIYIADSYNRRVLVFRYLEGAS